MNLKLKVLHVRTWQNRDGSEGKWWTTVGTAWMNDKGVDLTLHYVPVATDKDGNIRLVLREDDGQPAGAGNQQAPVGSRQQGAQRVNQAFGQQRPQAPAQGPGGFQGGGLRPQHRDGLGGGQGAQYGGAASQHSLAPGGGGGSDDDIPFAPVDSRLL